MSFKLKINQLTELFNPDSIHRGISIQKLKKLGKTKALQILLKTNFHKGLTNDISQHSRRRAFYGTNHPRIKKQHTLWEIICMNFQDQFIRIMIAAGIVSLVLGVLSEGLQWGWVQSCSIFFAVALVVLVSSINNYAHQKSFQIYKGESHQQQSVRVYRGGKLYVLDPEQLMVGDIVEVASGQKNSVDGILISCENLLIDQSQITGETMEVVKRVPMTYSRHEGADPFILSSSKVTSGMGIMLVVAVGQHSYYGNLTAKMDQQHLDSPLRQKLTNFSNQINESGMFFGVFTFSSLLIHYLYWCFLDQNPMDSLFSKQTLSRLVEAILVTFTIDIALPQTLPLLVTIALAKTARQLQHQKIFVKQLKQCQTMGSIDNLCLSKTGFVSKNLLSVSEIFVQQRITNVISSEVMSQSTCNLLNLAIIMNTQANPKIVQGKGNTIHIEHIGNRTECALLQMSYRMGYNYERFRLNSKVKRIYSTTIPKKKMATVYKDQKGKMYLFVKGSPKFFLPYCTYYINRQEQVEKLTFQALQLINKAILHFNSTNQKILMIAYKQVSSAPTKWSQVDKNLVLIAIIGIKDFIRDGVKDTIKQCQNLGITVRMLSSQNRFDAIGAAKQSGILPQNWAHKGRHDYSVVQGADFRQLIAAITKQDKTNIQRKLAIQNFKRVKDKLKVIYRASAEDKLLLAIGLKQCGHVVAMAGNGTNDTEALRKADISISMGLTCNETAKEASDIVILDDSFSSILTTITWGRHTFNIIKKFIALQLTINLVAAVMALLGAIFFGQSPLHPVQMLWINIIIDMLGSISLILEKPSSKLLNINPCSRKQKILTTDMVKLIVAQACIQIVILSIILFQGPDILGMVSSVQVEYENLNVQTGKHGSIFFNIFIMLQIFNQYNMRVLNFETVNVFQGLFENPLFLCFSVTSFILQFATLKYGGKFLYLTELSFNENVFCFVLGSLSISGNYCLKVIIPKNIKFSKNGFEYGNLKYQWKKQKGKDNEMSYLPIPQAEFELLSPKFSNFLHKRVSYIQQKESINDEDDDSPYDNESK